MRRGCGCDRVAFVGGRRAVAAFVPGRDCGHCWAFWADPAVNRARGGTGPLPVQPPPGARPLPCAHEGAVVEWCTACGPREGRHVRDCDLHDRCTRQPVGPHVRACAACPDYLPDVPEPGRDLGPVGRRHLAYHVLPVAEGGVWRRRVAALRAAWPLFDGAKVVAVMTGTGVQPRTAGSGQPTPVTLDPPDLVRAALPPDAEAVELPNDPQRRESVSWLPLWERVLAAAADDDAVLYGQAKGVTRWADPTCQRWADLIDDLYLGHWPATADLLRRYPVVGSLKKVGRGWGDSPCPWHYSGSWLWARAGEVRRRPWRELPAHWSAVEMWPGLAFHEREAGVLFWERPVPESDFYKEATWASRVWPAYRDWLRSRPPAATASASG